MASGVIGLYVSTQNKLLLQTARNDMLKLEDRLVQRINGTYRRTKECEIMEANAKEALIAITERVKALESVLRNNHKIEETA